MIFTWPLGYWCMMCVLAVLSSIIIIVFPYIKQALNVETSHSGLTREEPNTHHLLTVYVSLNRPTYTLSSHTHRQTTKESMNDCS